MPTDLFSIASAFYLRQMSLIRRRLQTASRPPARFADKRSSSTRRMLSLVVGAALVVHGGALAKPARPVEPSQQAAETRELILAAVQSGRIEDLRPAMEHATPDFGAGRGADPIAALKQGSLNDGLEALAAMGEALRLAPAALPLGKDLENNLIYVWPYLAEKPIDTLAPNEMVELLQLVPPERVREMREKKRWLWWRLAIGADGSWLMFKKAE